MIKAIAATSLALLLMGTSFALAEDAAPAATPQDMLTLLYVSGSLVEFCKLPVDPAVGTRISADQSALEKQLGLDATAAKAQYDQVNAGIVASKPDCSPTNEQIVAVKAMMDAYAKQ